MDDHTMDDHTMELLDAIEAVLRAAHDRPEECTIPRDVLLKVQDALALVPR